MNSRTWYPAGVSNSGPGLDAETVKHLQTIVSSHEIEAQNIAPFLEEIDKAVGAFRGMKTTYENSLPSQTRINLKQFQQSVLLSNDHMNQLDGQSLLLLRAVGPNAPQVIRDSINRIVNLINKAQTEGDQFQQSGGRLKDYPKIILAAHVAHAIREHLGRKPTITREGMFEEILRIVIGTLNAERQGSTSVDNHEPSVRDLMRKALKVIVTSHPGGALEFDPRVD